MDGSMWPSHGKTPPAPVRRQVRPGSEPAMRDRIRSALAPGRATMTLLLVVCGALASRAAEAAPKKKYHFELTAVTAKSEVKPDVSKAATPRIEAQVKKVFEGHPQLVAHLEGAP